MIQYPDDLGSKFRFVTLSSLRCEQLHKGAKARITSRSDKHTTIAQEEVMNGEVREMSEEEIAAEQAASVEQTETPEEAPEPTE